MSRDRSLLGGYHNHPISLFAAKDGELFYASNVSGRVIGALGYNTRVYRGRPGTPMRHCEVTGVKHFRDGGSYSLQTEEGTLHYDAKSGRHGWKPPVGATWSGKPLEKLDLADFVIKEGVFRTTIRAGRFLGEPEGRTGLV